MAVELIILPRNIFYFLILPFFSLPSHAFTESVDPVCVPQSRHMPCRFIPVAWISNQRMIRIGDYSTWELFGKGFNVLIQ